MKVNTGRDRMLRVLIASLFIFPLSGAAEVLFQDDFESGSFKQAKSGGAGWNGGNGGNVTVSDEMAAGGARAARFLFKGKPSLKDDATAELRFELGGLHKEIWMKFDLFVPSNYRHRNGDGSDNNKGPVMLWSGPYNGTPLNTYFQFWRASNADSTGTSIVAAGWMTDGKSSISRFDPGNLSRLSSNAKWERVMIDPATDGGKWMELVVNIKAADPGQSNGVVQLWKNGKPVWAARNATNRASNAAVNGYERGYFLGWANSGFDVDTVLFIDNVIVATDEADLISSSSKVSPPSPPALHIN